MESFQERAFLIFFTFSGGALETSILRDENFYFSAVIYSDCFYFFPDGRSFESQFFCSHERQSNVTDVG